MAVTPKLGLNLGSSTENFSTNKYNDNWYKLDNATLTGLSETENGSSPYRGNTALGALALNTTKNYPSSSYNYNTAIGLYAAQYNTGSYNTAVGKRSLGGGVGSRTTSGGYNSAVGSGSLQALTTGSYNSAFGINSLYSLTSGGKNVGIGDNSLYYMASGSSNIGIGSYAGQYLTGSYNVAIGYYSLARTSASAAGNYNTAVGYYAGKMNWSTSTSGVTPTALSNTTCIGAYAYPSADNQVQLGGYGTTVYGASAYNSRSDERDKAEIQDLTYDALEFIKALTPRNYKVDPREGYTEDEVLTVEEWRDSGLTLEEQSSYNEELDEERSKFEGYEIFRYRKTKFIPKDGSKKGKRLHNGFVAQEVSAVAKNLGFDFAGWQDHSYNGGGDVQTLAYEEFIAPLVKAVQVLANRVEALEG